MLTSLFLMQVLLVVATAEGYLYQYTINGARLSIPTQLLIVCAHALHTIGVTCAQVRPVLR